MPTSPIQAERLQHALKNNIRYCVEAKSDENVWKYISSDRFIPLQIEELGTLAYSHSDLDRALEIFERRAGATPTDDARLSWTALRKGELHWQAAQEAKECIEKADRALLEDIHEIKFLLHRMEALDTIEIIRSSLILLLKVTFREGARQDTAVEYLTQNLMSILRRQLTPGKQYLDWKTIFASTEMLSFWIAKVDGCLAVEEWLSIIRLVLPQRDGLAEILTSLTTGVAHHGALRATEILFERVPSASVRNAKLLRRLQPSGGLWAHGGAPRRGWDE